MSSLKMFLSTASRLLPVLDYGVVGRRQAGSDDGDQISWSGREGNRLGRHRLLHREALQGGAGHPKHEVLARIDEGAVHQVLRSGNIPVSLGNQHGLRRLEALPGRYLHEGVAEGSLSHPRHSRR